jgi:hypothetical protein
MKKGEQHEMDVSVQYPIQATERPVILHFPLASGLAAPSRLERTSQSWAPAEPFDTVTDLGTPPPS